MGGRTKNQGDAPKEIYNWKMYSASICAGFGGALFGYDNAFLGGTLALPSFRQHFGLTGLSTNAVSTLESNIIITFQAGCFAACFAALPCAEILGRRISLLIASVIFIVGAAIQLTGNLNAFYAGRFLTGLGVGPMTSLAPLYVSEIAPPFFRGRCVGIFECCYQVGGLLGFWINYGVSLHLPGNSPTQWRVPVAMQLPLIGAFFLGAFMLPESPRFLIKKDRLEQAEAVLARLRGLGTEHPYLRRELADIQDEVQVERAMNGLGASDSYLKAARAVLSECLRPQMMHRISVGMITQTIGQLSGINGINYYSPKIFRSLGVVGTSTSLFATGIYGVVKTISATVSLVFLVDRLGRKTLLLSGCVIMSISLFFVGGYIKVANPVESDQTISNGGIAACAFIYIYVIGFTSSFAGIPFILSSECVPISVRAISATVGAATHWLMNLVITKATPYMISSIGFGTFFFFGSCVVVGAVYVWFFVPETKGVLLEHMAAAFGHEDFVEDHRATAEKAAGAETAEQVDHP